MAYGGLPAVPKGFEDLYSAWNHPLPYTGDKHSCDMIGVCVDFLEASQSRGTDITMKLTLHDPYFINGNGIEFRLFFKELSAAPPVRNQGDIVILHQGSTCNHEKLGKIAWSTWNSTWAVIENESLSNSTAEDYSDVVIHRPLRSGRQAPVPTVEQIKYAKTILELEDSSRWQAPAKATSLQINNIMVASGGKPTVTAVQKDKVISELFDPGPNRLYVNLVAEVRRSYTTDMKMELSVTDYTENTCLYDYKHTPTNDGFDPGDRFGYVDSGGSHKAWPGPWGKRTINVVLWEPHRSWAVKHLKPGSLVQLKNVHVKLDPQAAKLEGVCHEDKMFPDRILVSTFKPHDAERNAWLRDLLKRKRAYEEHCKAFELRFVRDADPNKVLSPKRDRVDINTALEEAPRDSKAKKNRKKKEKQRAKAAAAASANKDADSGTISKNSEPTNQSDAAPSLAPNAHVRTVASTQSTLRIDQILDPQSRAQITAAGNKWIAPFVNRKYKSKVKVVNFVPDRLEDFAIYVKRNEYADARLSDAEDEEEIGSNSDSDDNNAMAVDEDESTTRKGKWEWRFALFVEDPTPSKASHERQQLRVILPDKQAEYLLRDSACNLRKNPAALAKLREKMFVLWGDLGELREEMWAGLRALDPTGISYDELKDKVETAKAQVQQAYKSQPFECFIEEYGVLREIGLKGDKEEDWVRCFRMTETTIA